MESNIEKDLDNLSKNLYLESPDLWIDYSDKISSGVFDELVVFFATKYNYISIVKHSIENKLIDIDSQSKNKDFNTIYDHLIYMARQNTDKDIYNYLDTLKNPSKEISKDNKSIKNNEIDNNNNYENINIPSVICNKCKSNIFEVGYIVSENKVFKYSPQKNKPVEIKKEELNSVVCLNCNSLIEDTTPKDLEALCNITTCIKCKNDLRTSGIVDKTNLIYNKELNKFDLGNTYYACCKCENPISEQQKEFFNLK